MEEVLGGALRQSRRNLLQLEELSKQVMEERRCCWAAGSKIEALRSPKLVHA